jgi:hypothetical protein
VASRAASTSLAALDAGFGAGLLEAACQVAVGRAPVLLVVSDTPYPEPLNAVRPLTDHFGVALLLAPEGAPRSLAALTLRLGAPDSTPPTPCRQPSLEALRRGIPAAAGLPLLEALVSGISTHRIVLGDEPTLVIDCHAEGT